MSPSLKFATPFFLAALASPVIAAVQVAQPPATAQAAQAGIKTCLPPIEIIETWMARGQTGDAVAFWDNAAPDKNLFSALLALENKTGNSLTNLNVIPLPDGQCMVEYTHTAYVPQACKDYLKGMGEAARFVRDLNSKTALIQGQGVQIYLSPAGQGCLAMRKEIVKQPGNPPQAPRMTDGTKR